MMSFMNNTEVEESKENRSRMEDLKKRKAEEAEADKAKMEEATGLITMPVVGFRQKYGTANKVETVEFEGVAACEGAPVIVGLPGSGLASAVASGYLSKQLGLPVVAVMRVPSLQPQGVVINSVPYQSLRIYGNEKLVVIQSELQVNKGAMVHNLIAAILDFCGRHSSRTLISIDGIPTKPTDMEDANRLRFLTTDEAFSKHMKGLNHLAVVNGIIGGLTGQLMADAPLAEPPILGLTAIMAKLDARLPSAESSVAIVNALNEFLLGEDKVDTTELEESAFELEQALQEAMKKAKADIEAGGGAKSTAPSSMSCEQVIRAQLRLKACFFCP